MHELDYFKVRVQCVVCAETLAMEGWVLNLSVQKLVLCSLNLFRMQWLWILYLFYGIFSKHTEFFLGKQDYCL
jgi:hypothetical protein